MPDILIGKRVRIRGTQDSGIVIGKDTEQAHAWLLRLDNNQLRYVMAQHLEVIG